MLYKQQTNTNVKQTLIPPLARISLRDAAGVAPQRLGGDGISPLLLC